MSQALAHTVGENLIFCFSFWRRAHYQFFFFNVKYLSFSLNVPGLKISGHVFTSHHHTRVTASILILQMKKNLSPRISLVLQWLRLCAPDVLGPGSHPWSGTRSCLLQLKYPAYYNSDLAQTNTYSKQKKKLKLQRSGLCTYIKRN